MSEEAKRKIEEMITAVGAMGELLGEEREAFMRNGFTREEAVSLCAVILRCSFDQKYGGDSNDEP